MDSDSSGSEEEWEKQETSVKKLQKHFPDLDKEVRAQFYFRLCFAWILFLVQKRSAQFLRHLTNEKNVLFSALCLERKLV